MTKEMKQWHAAMDKALAEMIRLTKKFPNAQFLVLAINPDIDDMAMLGNGCPHENSQMIALAIQRNNEALFAHEAMGEHGRN